MHCPQVPWIGEVEKRSFLFQAAHLYATPGEDWIWICDADEVISHGHGLRDALEATELDVAEVLLWERGVGRDEVLGQFPIRKLFRAQASGITVEHHHARYVTGDGRVLWDAAGHACQEPAETLWDIRVRHRPGERHAYRTENRAQYYDRRARLGLEV